jgi:hypothetical protein
MPPRESGALSACLKLEISSPGAFIQREERSVEKQTSTVSFVNEKDRLNVDTGF